MGCLENYPVLSLAFVSQPLAEAKIPLNTRRKFLSTLQLRRGYYLNNQRSTERGEHQMVNILLVTHGEFAQGITSALTLIMGEAKGYATVSLNIGQAPDAFLDELSKKVHSLYEDSEGSGVLVLTDLFGGTPCNCIARIMNEMGTEKVRCVTGLNLPMLIEVVSDRDEQDLPQLEETALAAGGKGMVSLAEKIFG